VEDQSFKGGADEADSDCVVVQREQIEELELWFFGISDAQIGHGVIKYLQSHLLDRNPKEVIKTAPNASSFSRFLSGT
jgi:protein phosphatase PTC1